MLPLPTTAQLFYPSLRQGCFEGIRELAAQIGQPRFVKARILVVGVRQKYDVAIHQNAANSQVQAVCDQRFELSGESQVLIRSACQLDGID